MSDLISRQAVMKEFSDFVRRANNSDFAKTPTWNDAVSLVGSLPSEEVTLCHLDNPCEYQNADIAMPNAEKVGWWIEHEWAEEYDGKLISNYECSECKSWERERTNYCPNCGAKMEGEGDE